MGTPDDDDCDGDDDAFPKAFVSVADFWVVMGNRVLISPMGPDHQQPRVILATDHGVA